MKYLCHLVRFYPVSCFYILIIWVLCFATIPHTPLDNVTLIDKWVHMAMYGGTCGTIWVEYVRRHAALSWRKLFLMAWLAPVAMGGLIEILQATCTGGRRSGDWLDFAANSIGVTLAAVVAVVCIGLRRAKRH